MQELRKQVENNFIRRWYYLASKLSDKYINDNIYGGIRLSELEFDIINTSSFQRLRRIKQQGLTSYTFPSSDHTRFSHSLGVLHVMGKLTDNLRKIDAIDEKARAKLRLAALLHDIGHYPLSHLTESVYLERYNQSVGNTDIVREIPNSQVSTEFVSPLIRFWKKVPRNSAHHEYIGFEVIKRRNDINRLIRKAKIDPEEIGGIITGDTTIPIFHQLMHSSLDADRLDYLLRDSSAAGVTYGLIDLDYLTRLTTYYEDENTSDRMLAINEKGIHVLEHYLMARYFSYSQITMHRTTSAFETLAKALIWELAEKQVIYPMYEDIIGIIKSHKYLEFDDNYLWRKMNTNKLDTIYKTYRRTLKERRKLKILYEIKDISNKRATEPKNSAYSIIKRKALNDFNYFASVLQIPIQHIGYTEQRLSIDVSAAELSEPDKSIEAPRIKTSNGGDYLVHYNGSLLRELFNRELKIFRIFYIDPYPDNRHKSDELKRQARQEINSNLQLREQ